MISAVSSTSLAQHGKRRLVWWVEEGTKTANKILRNIDHESKAELDSIILQVAPHLYALSEARPIGKLFIEDTAFC